MPEDNIGACNYHLCNKVGKLQKCPYCENYFCKEHIKPRMTINRHQLATAPKHFQNWLEKEFRREDGHPDFVYTRIAWQEMEKKKEEADRKFDEILDILNKMKNFPQPPPVDVIPKLFCSKCGKKIDQNEKFHCTDCKKDFCPEHLNPENHNCIRLHSAPSSRKKIPIAVIAFAVLIFVAGLYFYENPQVIQSILVNFPAFAPKCNDSTLYYTCSNNQPYYCNNGNLIKNSTFCGCPYDYKPKGDDCEKIMRCTDGTPYGECSVTKPSYCLNGVFVSKASSCGCPMDEVAQGDNCVSKFMIGPKEIELNYVGAYLYESINFTVYKGLNDYLTSLPRAITYYPDTESPPTTKDFIMKKLDDPQQKIMLDPLVDKIKSITSNTDDQAKIAITLVQLIPYDNAAFASGDIFGKYPYEVLYTKTGVCSEKSYLLAYLLRGLGYGVSILEFKTENHDAVGIKCPSQYTYKNTGYCFVESTGIAQIGDSSEYYVGVGQLTSTPDVIVISDGYSLTSILSMQQGI